MKPIPRLLHCDSHGAAPWEGDICCDQCHAIYQVRSPLEDRYAPLACECGVRLCPAVNENPNGAYSWAPICHGCAIAPRGRA